MHVGVAFGDQTVQYELDEDRLIGRWSGPEPAARLSVHELLRAALDHPQGYPPLGKCVVPGDRVVIALDAGIPDLSEIVSTLCEVLFEAGVEARSITVLATESPVETGLTLPDGVGLEIHNPEDRARIAYLASTSSGRRVYLDRIATDADVVVPVGVLAHGGEIPGYRGPWSEVFPGLSDRKTRDEFHAARKPDEPLPGAGSSAAMVESAEVSWLLGSQFQIGVEVGVSGTTGIIAGHEDMVRRCGVEAIDAAWTVRPDRLADLTLAGVGVSWKPPSLEDLAAGIETAARLTRVGGKVVALSQVSVPPGRAVQRLSQLEDPRAGVHVLRGLEHEEDFPIAVRLAAALARADIYLSSGLDPELVEGLGMIPLDDPREARRLVRACASYIVLSPAEWMRAVVPTS